MKELRPLPPVEHPHLLDGCTSHAGGHGDPSAEDNLEDAQFTRRVKRGDSMAARHVKVQQIASNMPHSQLGEVVESEEEADEDDYYVEEEEEDATASSSSGVSGGGGRGGASSFSSSGKNSETSDLTFARRVKRSDSLAVRREKAAAVKQQAMMNSGSKGPLGLVDEEAEEDIQFVSRVRASEDHPIIPTRHSDGDLDLRRSVLDAVGETPVSEEDEEEDGDDEEEDADDFVEDEVVGSAIGTATKATREEVASSQQPQQQPEPQFMVRQAENFQRRMKRNDSLAQHRASKSKSDQQQQQQQQLLSPKSLLGKVAEVTEEKVEGDLTYKTRVHESTTPRSSHVDVVHNILDPVRESSAETAQSLSPHDEEATVNIKGEKEQFSGASGNNTSGFMRRVKRNDSLAGHRAQVAAKTQSLKQSNLLTTVGESRFDEEPQEEQEQDKKSAQKQQQQQQQPQRTPVLLPSDSNGESDQQFVRRVKRSDTLSSRRPQPNLHSSGHSILPSDVLCEETGEALEEEEEEDDEDDEEEEEDGTQSSSSASSVSSAQTVLRSSRRNHTSSVSPDDAVADIQFARRVKRSDTLSSRRADLPVNTRTALTEIMAEEEEEEEEEDDDDDDDDVVAVSDPSPPNTADPTASYSSMPSNFVRRVKRNDSLAGHRAQVAAKRQEYTHGSILGTVGEQAEEEQAKHASSTTAAAVAAAIASVTAPNDSSDAFKDASFTRRVKRNDSLAGQRAKVATKKQETMGKSSILGSVGEDEN